ncbi:MAG: isopentenyl-diphosphate Delta-isomerase [Bacteroidota bacterium]
MEEQVILVDDRDHAIGLAGKMEAHLEGLLHRAFSVFVFNSKQELLLQKRAAGKYHSAGLWTNTCCSHPRAGEETKAAAHRRLLEEMGLRCELKEVFSFTYKAVLENELIEHEFDHVFIGTSDEFPVLNTDEAEEYGYVSIDELSEALRLTPEKYTSWLRICWPQVAGSIRKSLGQ